MGTDDHILISLSGEGPWGFRLQGGSEKSLPLLVSKVRKRSKACRGGLRENDELISINGKVCAGLSHAEAMLMIDSSGSNLYLRVKRAGAGAQTVPRPHRSQDPPSSWAVSSSSKSTPGQPKLLHLESITSPPDSEAYYGETDSDADIQTSPGHPQSTQQHHSQQQLPPEKHRRARKKSPRSPPGNNMKTETEQQSLSEMSGYESGPGCVSECAVVPTGGVAKREITYQPGGSRAETPFSDVEGFLPAEEEQQISSVSAPSPESLLLPHATKTIRAERHLIPMIGPVEHPVDEDLTTSYSEKAKEAKLHRSESVQEKNVKEARTKCRTIASLLTDAPNPHSKGVLMFKKRRQRAKKYTLVSYGSVDEDRYNEDEDGVFPTSESEFDEEGFSDARSLTNHSDWDSTYLDIEKPKMEHEQQEEKGLSEASGKGAEMFEMQRQRSEQFSVDTIPPQNPQEQQTARPVPPQRRTASARSSVNAERSQDTGSSESTKVASTNISLSTSQPTQESNVDASATADGIFNRSARPFTPGQVGQRTVASSVTFNPSTQKRVSECVQNLTPSPFTQFSPTALVSTQKASGSSVASLYIPAPGKPTVSSTTQHAEGTRASEIPSVAITPRTTTASIYLSSPLRPSGPQTESSQPVASKLTDPTPVTPLAHPASHIVSPASSVLKEAPSFTPAVTSINLSPESVSSREQRISVPVGRTGILNEARKRGGRKQMFAKVEEKKCLPNPELLSMVQNLDEKPKQDQPGTGFESGPEEDFLSLGAEACNFMQSSARKLKVPPPVAPKPSLKATPEQLVNGNQDMPQLKGKGAELFAKRQSRMDKFVVDSTRSSSSRPNSRPRTPSPTPSLPSAWKYSSNIRAPPPIAYNPIHSPFYPLAASKSQPSKVESKVKKSPPGKARMQAIDFMRHQPYQLNSAMFCFGDSSNTTNQNPSSQETGKSHLLITPARQAPVKTARTHDIKRFSTPTPMSSSVNMAPTVLTPRSATTLAEPVWRTDVTCQSMPSSAVTATPYQTPPQGVLQNFDTVENRAATVLSPTSSITSPRSSISRIQVPKPRFSASKIGIQANVWRPAKVTF
ncbi:synaptopodin 2-like protein [Spea bombifrons]|uniref:synaptopodin 2-like protein n=1 Tax=Spea bombifrons TaxID=233779 RepID=UPI00234A03F5|nr:synaptopodin 2-like protein [Spea bombifrons]